MFAVFLIVAAWNLSLPQWLQVCITVFGALHVLCGMTVRIAHEYKERE